MIPSYDRWFDQHIFASHPYNYLRNPSSVPSADIRHFFLNTQHNANLDLHAMTSLHFLHVLLTRHTTRECPSPGISRSDDEKTMCVASGLLRSPHMSRAKAVQSPWWRDSNLVCSSSGYSHVGLQSLSIVFVSRCIQYIHICTAYKVLRGESYCFMRVQSVPRHVLIILGAPFSSGFVCAFLQLFSIFSGFFLAIKYLLSIVTVPSGVSVCILIKIPLIGVRWKNILRSVEKCINVRMMRFHCLDLWYSIGTPTVHPVFSPTHMHIQ